jgi:hypothetical protein
MKGNILGCVHPIHNTLKGDFAALKYDPTKRFGQSGEPNHREPKTGTTYFFPKPLSP